MSLCKFCSLQEKAKAIDKVETQESAATAIQALARAGLSEIFLSLLAGPFGLAGGRAARKATGLDAADPEQHKSKASSKAEMWSFALQHEMAGRCC